MPYLKIFIAGFFITAAVAIPLGIFLYRYMRKKMDSYDYDFSKDSWNKWETDEDWENWNAVKKNGKG